MQAQLAREAAVVRCHCILPNSVGQTVRYALCQGARIDEDQRGTMLLGELRETVIDLVPHLMRHHRREWTRRNFHSKVEPTPVAYVYNFGLSGGTREKFGYQFDGLLRR